MTVRTAKEVIVLLTDKETWKKILIVLILIFAFSSSCISCLSCTTAGINYVASNYNNIDILNKKVQLINDKIEQGQPKVDPAFYISTAIYYYNSVLSGTMTFYKPELLSSGQSSSEMSSSDEQSMLLIETIGDDFLSCFYEIKEIEVKKSSNTTSSQAEKRESSTTSKKKKTKTVYMAYENKTEIFNNIEKIIGYKLDEKARSEINSYYNEVQKMLNGFSEGSNAEKNSANKNEVINNENS